MARLVLVDTADQLPGLLPLHAWSALMTSELVIVGSSAHPFLPHLDIAELRHEVIELSDEGAALSRADLLSGLAPGQKRQAELVVDRVGEVGEAAYLFGSSDSEAFTRTLGMEAARAGVEVEVVYFGVAPKGVRLLELVAVEERLLGPEGCPWDREQTHASLGRYAIEEVYELLEAIESGEPEALREELGDVLLQVIFHAEMAEVAGDFTIDDVAGGIAEKLVRRHPHVFADTKVADSGEVMANWEELKAAEKPERSGVFDGVVGSQPALQLMGALQRRAAKVGFDWPADADALAAVRAEVDEVANAASPEELATELGDLLGSVVGLARRRGVDPESALRASAGRFRRRFEHMVAQTGERELSGLTRQEWLVLWAAAKAAT